MKRATQNRSTSAKLLRFASFGLIFLLSLVLLDRPVLADSGGGLEGGKGGKGRVAPDLAALLQVSGGNSVRVVLTFREDAGNSISDWATGKGGRVRGHYRRVRVMAIDLPADEVEHLAEQDGVEYVTP